MPHLVVLGAGFGGLIFCKRFKGPARVTIVDRQNHHLFQPLLYQVATAGLSSEEISQPIRSILSPNRHLNVLMDEVPRISLADKTVVLADHVLRYDYLVLALGVQTSWFGHDDWAGHTAGLKSLEDAVGIRESVLMSFERAEATELEAQRRRLTTVVVVGGGATGVELAGAFAELTRRVFHHDFRMIDPTQTRVMLIEAGPRLLPAYPDRLSSSARRQLEALGVEVHTSSAVTHIRDGRLETAD